jgi:CubicO group peptidase (beta-lactamase class C family)
MSRTACRKSVGSSLLVVVACWSAPLRSAVPPDGPTEPAAAVREALDDLEDRGFGGVVLIDIGGEVFTEGMGMADRRAGLANGPSTVFDIGSLTKQFTAAAILRLEMDGVLSVDDTLGDHVTGLPADRSAMTLHQLLTHTAGLPDTLGDDDEPVSRDEYLELVASTPLVRSPGTSYEYSNVGYSLLAAVVEIVTGQSYDQYLRDALFEPAGMLSTGYVLPDFDEHDVAVGYDGDEAVGRPNELGWDDDGPFWHLRGNGGILSTAEDMHRWHVALLGDDILDAAAKEKFYARHTTEGPDADTFYGYGWAIVPTPFDTWLVTHNGGNGIFFADFLRFLDEDVTIFLATNAARDSDEDAAYVLAEAIFDGTDRAP